jgi:tetratricopeptide (TPR) repeat protein
MVGYRGFLRSKGVDPMRCPRSKTLALALALPLPLVGAAPTRALAQSAETESADALAKDARGHYDQGRFEQAVASYLKAYRQSPSAGFLYNVAVIYDRKLNEGGLAIDFYRRYIVADDADPAAVERATARIKALKSVAAAEPVPVEPAPAPASRPAATTEPESTASVSPAPADGETATSGRKIAAYTLMGIGGAALVGGVALGVLASTVEDKYAKAETVGDKKNMQSLGRSEALAGDLLMGGGVALAGVGLVLLLTGGGDSAPKAAPAAESEPEVGFSPLPGGFAVFFGGAL